MCYLLVELYDGCNGCFDGWYWMIECYIYIVITLQVPLVIDRIHYGLKWYIPERPYRIREIIMGWNYKPKWFSFIALGIAGWNDI